MPTTYLAPDPINSTQFIPGSATPANGGQLFFYAAGTSTKQTVYKDNAAATSWSNPIVLDSGGNLPSGGVVWFTQGQTYKVVFAPSNDTDPPASPYWSKDNLAGINDVSATSSEWVSGPTPTFVSATSFTLTGDQTSTFTVGRRIRTTNTGGTVYSTIIGSNFGSVTTIVVQNDSGVLDSGLSAVAYSLLGTANASIPRATQVTRPEVRGRLTLVAGQPITSSDVSTATSVVFTPYQGNTVDLYDGSGAWRTVTFSEMSVAVPTTTAVHDVFVSMNSSGTVSLTSLAWTNLTTRATNLTTQSGVYVQSGDTTKLYLGTYFGTTISGTSRAVDSRQYRYLSNYWNPVQRNFNMESTSGSYLMNSSAAGTTRPANSDSSNAVGFVTGLQGSPIMAELIANWNPNNNTHVSYALTLGLALDNASTFSGNGHHALVQAMSTAAGSAVIQQQAKWSDTPVPGAHILYWIELMTSGSGAITVIGTTASRRSGISGSLLG